MQISRHRWRLGLLAGVASLPMLGGCAAVGPRVVDAADDRCAPLRAAFRSTADETTQTVVRGAAVGGIAGAITGYATTGDLRGAMVGAAAGAGMGALAGLVYAQMSQEQRVQALGTRFREAQNIATAADRGLLAFDAALTCRRQQRDEIRTAFQRRQLTREQAEARMAQVRRWHEEDLALAQAYDGQLAGRSTQLAQASNEIRAGSIPREREVALAGFSPFSGFVRTDAVVRSAPSADAASIATLPAGSALRATAREGEWLRVEAPGRRPGFVRLAQVQREGAPRRYTARAAEPVRAQPLDAAAEIGRLGPGQSRQVTGVIPGGWLAVDVGQSRRGFVPESAMQVAGAASLETQESELISAASTSLALRNSFNQRVEQARGSADNDFVLDG